MKRELEQIEIPNEHEARVRSLAVVREAFAEREPQPRRRSWKPLAAIAIALVVVAGLLSPPGRAVLDDIREVVGVEKAQPALFSLPAPGRLLVTADSGAWVVERGRLEAASRQLPRGLVVSVRPLRRRVARERAGRADPGRRRALVARPAERPLPALGRHGDGHAHRLSLARAAARRRRRRQGRPAARSAGSRERRRSGSPGRGTSLWPTRGATGSVRVVDVDTRRRCSIATRRRRWRSNDSARKIAAADARDPADFDRAGAVARRPLARGRLARRRPARLPALVGRRQIRAVSNVSSQFRSRSFPTISGWCCAP